MFVCTAAIIKFIIKFRLEFFFTFLYNIVHGLLSRILKTLDFIIYIFNYLLFTFYIISFIYTYYTYNPCYIFSLAIMYISFV